MEWRDQGYVLAARRHGEADIILTLLTRDHGRHLGLARGGASRAKRPAAEIGTLVSAQWRARLSEQLGHFQIEQVHATAARFLDDALKLSALSAACAILDAALPEREPHPELFDGLSELLMAIAERADWPMGYIRWEAALLSGLGFGLDLGACAITGATEGLAYVSPRTGRAVTAQAAKGYESRLLRLPRFLLREDADCDAEALKSGLALTGHFLRAHVAQHVANAAGFAQRDRLVELLLRHGA